MEGDPFPLFRCILSSSPTSLNVDFAPELFSDQLLRAYQLWLQKRRKCHAEVAFLDKRSTYGWLSQSRVYHPDQYPPYFCAQHDQSSGKYMAQLVFSRLYCAYRHLSQMESPELVESVVIELFTTLSNKDMWSQVDEHFAVEERYPRLRQVIIRPQAHEHFERQHAQIFADLFKSCARRKVLQIHWGVAMENVYPPLPDDAGRESKERSTELHSNHA
ncbi:unnamed protein product [Somion occarium]|uniref:Uncharacterized protein n=1 Tax=Somion occarium TaxID=3059160 RepID=A0ABP1D538_9APHY